MADRSNRGWVEEADQASAITGTQEGAQTPRDGHHERLAPLGRARCPIAQRGNDIHHAERPLAASARGPAMSS